MTVHFEDALYPEEAKMRVIPLVFAAFVVSSPALAEGWEEYAYPDYAFAVAFPANPQVETTTYHVADNRSVPARLYSVRQGNLHPHGRVSILFRRNNTFPRPPPSGGCLGLSLNSRTAPAVRRWS
jgi:hypothetical protein